jgi:uncharacterized membrane protein
MRWLTLYLRSRRVPVALAAAVGYVAVTWSLWTAFSDTRDVDVQLVILTVLLTITTAAATLSGPDDALERTGALPWPPRRAAHLLAALTIVLLLLLATLMTGTRFAPAWLVVRDTAGLLGLTALGAATIGTARSWFLPLAWTLTTLTLSLPDTAWGQILTWQAQAPDNIPAALTAGLLAVAGLVTYVWVGPARRAPAEAAL